jgi:crotonobetainyl-CoA:carnitine CoA-transferase CaiB-like acyl-CoA transferase
MEKQALENLRVIDLTEYISGPYCTKLLSGFGAEVIKLELPKTGDGLRGLGPFFKNQEGVETSIPFLWLNTGKMGMTLNLETEEGVKIAKELIHRADVLVEAFSPGVMAKLGLGYETLKENNPQLVMISISDFGQTGPYKSFKAEEIQMQALSGMMYLTGDPDRPPLASGPALCQYTAGLHAYVATLLALFQKRAGGGGQHVDVSKMECCLENIEVALTGYLQAETKARRKPHLGVPWDLYPCDDGYAAIIGMPARHWHRAAEIFEEPRLFDKQYDHLLDRIKHRHEYEEILENRLKTKKKEEVFRAGQSQGLAFGYLASLQEAFQSPQHKERQFFMETDHPEVGMHNYCGAPFKMSETPWQQERAPLLGEHNDRILRGILKYSQERLDRLRREGVI